MRTSFFKLLPIVPMPRFTFDFTDTKDMDLQVNLQERSARRTAAWVLSPSSSPPPVSPPYDLMTPKNQPGPSALPTTPALSSLLSQPPRSSCRPMKQENKELQ